MPSPAAEEDPGAPVDRRIRQLVDASDAYIWLLSPRGRVLHANPRAAELAGPEAQDGARNWRDVWPGANRFTLDRAVSEAQAGRRFAFRTRYPRADGVALYLDVAVSPIRDDDGVTDSLLVKAEDVTAAVESAALFSTVINTLPTALTVRDARTGRFVLANRAAEAMFDVDGLAGRRAEEVFPEPLLNWEAEEATASARPAGAVVQDPAQGRRLSVTRVGTFDDDGLRHVIGLAEDVTRQLADAEALQGALDQAKEASQAKSAFLTNLTHEIRTPLNGVVAGLDLLAGRSLPPGAAEVLEMVRGSAAALSRRLEELMAVASFGRFVAEPRPQALAVAPLLSRLAHRFAARAADKGLAIRVLGGAPDIWADPDCIENALAQLAGNAIKFTQAGEITLSAEALADGGVRVTVADTGIGFDPSLKSQMFDAFNQVERGLTRQYGGLGLGLSLACELARACDAVLDADSVPGQGARFWIDLPAAAPEERAAPGGDGPPRVLVADDHPTNRRIVELMLAEVAEVVSVEDGQAAVDAFVAAPFDLVLMDIQMPRLDGIAAVAQLRRYEAETGAPRTPIVMLTANTQDEHIRASQAAGADRHVAKPFTAAILMREIQNLLARESG